MSNDAAREVVLFVHSTGTGPFLWAGVPDAAIGGRAKVLPANLGYPPNPLIERGHEVTPADDAAEVLRAVPDGARVHVVGHSYGGLVALQALRTLEGRVASIFLFEPVLFGALAAASDADPEATAEARGFDSHPWFLHDPEKGGRAEWLEAFIDYWNRPGAWSRMPEQMRELSLMLGWKMFLEVRAIFRDATPFDAWALPGPTTIAVGERTTAASRAMSRRLARGRANVTLVDVPGVGHMAPLTHANQVHAELARHMARYDESAGGAMT
ncbi:MAG: alpha/beta hydrolase [Labilithrix sp.]|nr:alpha/beta hydrolase [Labilithrix sp.]MBX3216821.1 alpha/beta hydrolase [Labilithrix sp.]